MNRVEVGVGVFVRTGVGGEKRVGWVVIVGIVVGATTSVCKALHPVIAKTTSNNPVMNLHL